MKACWYIIIGIYFVFGWKSYAVQVFHNEEVGFGKSVRSHDRTTEIYDEKDDKLGNPSLLGFDEQCAPFDYLPNETIVHILKYLPLDTLGHIEQTSMRFQSLMKLTDVWVFNLKQVGIKNVEDPKKSCIINRDDINLRQQASEDASIILKHYTAYKNLLFKKLQYEAALENTYQDLQDLNQGIIHIGYICCNMFKPTINSYKALEQGCIVLTKEVKEARRKYKIVSK